MGSWRDDLIDPALDDLARKEIEAQKEWIARQPGDARPWIHLAQLYRTLGRQEEALGLLLEAARLEPASAAAHIPLVEIYAVKADYRAAWRHARLAECSGDPRGVQLLGRYGIPEE